MVIDPEHHMRYDSWRMDKEHLFETIYYITKQLYLIRSRKYQDQPSEIPTFDLKIYLQWMTLKIKT